MPKSPIVTKESPQSERTAQLAKALGHPMRLAILHILTQRNSCICGDISDQLPLAQSTVSQHLKVLKKAGWIKGEVEGVRTCYCLDSEGVNNGKKLLTDFLDQLDQSADPGNGTCCK